MKSRMNSMVVYASLLLNVILVLLLLNGLRGREALTREETGVSKPEAPPPERLAEAPKVAPVGVQVPVPKFHWSQVESTNYLAYIDNLRAIGCPEETIRDIIVLDVAKLFAPRFAALTGSAPELAWWGRYDERKPVRAELAARLRELHEEQKALLVRLLGPGVETELALVEKSVVQLRENYAYAFLPESKQDVQRQNDSMWRTMRDVAVEHGITPEAMGQAYAIKEDFLNRMVGALGPFFEDPARDPAPLRALAAAMEEQLTGVLGSESVKRLDRLGTLPRLVVEDDGKRRSYSFSRGGG